MVGDTDIAMLEPLIRLMRILHGTIGITEPKPQQEAAVALAWVALCVMLVAVFVIGLFVI